MGSMGDGYWGIEDLHDRLDTDFSISALIRFYSLSDVSVEVNSGPVPKDPPFAEQLLYTCLALRQLANIGTAPPSKRLEQFLGSVATHPLEVLRANRDRAFSFVTQPDAVPVISFHPRFTVVDKVAGFQMPLAPSTLHEPRLLHYGVLSVMVLYEYLAIQRIEDRGFLSRLALMSGLCAYEFRSGHLTIKNQLDRALQVATGTRTGVYDEVERGLKAGLQRARAPGAALSNREPRREGAQMGIFQDIYNWLAMRNIGEILGLEWIPAKDVRHQRKRFKELVDSKLKSLIIAKGLLEKGEAKKAGDIAYFVFADPPYAILPEIVRAYDLADEIIAKLPPDYVPPKPGAREVSARMAADQAAARLSEAAMLADQGEYKKAISMTRDVLNHEMFPHGGVRAIDVRLKTIDLDNALMEKLKRADPKT